MAGFKGRKIEFELDSATVDGVREKGITFNGEPIDVSDDDSAGVRELLDEMGEISVDLSISGVTKSTVLAMLAGKVDRSCDVELTYPNGLEISFPAVLVTYTDTGPYNDATTFEAEFQSAGAITTNVATP